MVLHPLVEVGSLKERCYPCARMPGGEPREAGPLHEGAALVTSNP